MEAVDNNQFEVKPNSKGKRKITTPCPNVYLNPALDLLANEDPMCNNAMEIVPSKKRKCTKSCDTATFENTALDVGVSKAAVNEFLVKELENVKKNVKKYNSFNENIVQDNHTTSINEPIYANVIENATVPRVDNSVVEFSIDNPFNTVNDNAITIRDEQNQIDMDSGISIFEQKPLVATNTSYQNDAADISIINNTTHVQTNVTNQIFINNTSNLNLSFIDRLALDSPNISSQSLYVDDDLNESNIMEIKTITIITKKKRIQSNFQNKSTNPFLDPNLQITNSETVDNPFVDTNDNENEMEYNAEADNRAGEFLMPQDLIARRLFASDTNSTISTVNDSENIEIHDYENIDSYRSESPIYENINEESLVTYSKQSKILGCDVSKFRPVDIMNMNQTGNTVDVPNDSTDSKKDLKHQFLKASNKLSRKVLKKFKKTFHKSDKPGHNVTLNPYEVPRKMPKEKTASKEQGIANPCLNLDNSDEIEIEELDDEEHQYETIKTIRNTRLNMNVTPLKERVNETNVSTGKNNTPSKKVRFDSTLNQEKVITGDSFDCGVQSPGFDAKIDKYHDELENCINEKKFLQQNM